MNSPPLMSSSPIESKHKTKEVYHCTICGRTRHLAQFCRFAPTSSNNISPLTSPKNSSFRLNLNNNASEFGSILPSDFSSNQPLYETRPYAMYRYMPKVLGIFQNNSIVNGVDVSEYNPLDDETKAIVESICLLCNIPVGVIPLPSYNTSLGIMYTYIYILKSINFGKSILNYDSGVFDPELGIYKISQVIAQVFGVVTAYDPTNPATAYLEYNIAKKEIQNYYNNNSNNINIPNNININNHTHFPNVISSTSSNSSTSSTTSNTENISDEVDDSFTTDTPETDLSSIDDCLVPFSYNSYRPFTFNNKYKKNRFYKNSNFRRTNYNNKRNHHRNNFQKLDFEALGDINNSLRNDIQLHSNSIHRDVDTDTDIDIDNDDDIEVLLPDLKRDDDCKKSNADEDEDDWSRETSGFWNEEMLLQKDWLEKQLADQNQTKNKNVDHRQSKAVGPDKLLITGRPPQSPSLQINFCQPSSPQLSLDSSKYPSIPHIALAPKEGEPGMDRNKTKETDSLLGERTSATNGFRLDPPHSGPARTRRHTNSFQVNTKVVKETKETKVDCRQQEAYPAPCEAGHAATLSHSGKCAAFVTASPVASLLHRIAFAHRL